MAEGLARRQVWPTGPQKAGWVRALALTKEAVAVQAKGSTPERLAKEPL